MSAGRSSHGGLLGGTVCWALHIRLLCCVVLRAERPRVSAGFCPSCPPLSLYRPASVSSSRHNVSFLTRSPFVLSFLFRLFLFTSVSASIVPLSFASFLSHLLSCPVLSHSDVPVTVFVLLPLFVFPLCLFVLILVIFLCALYFIVLAHCPLCLLWSRPSIIARFSSFSSACPACPEIPFFFLINLL